MPARNCKIQPDDAPTTESEKAELPKKEGFWELFPSL